MDLTRSKSELMLENALLRQQLVVLQRQVKRPALTWRDRTVMVLLASKLHSWKETLRLCSLIRYCVEVLRTPYEAPKANAHCERFLGSVRRECLDFFLILNEKHLKRVMKEYSDSLPFRLIFERMFIFAQDNCSGRRTLITCQTPSV